MHSTDEQRTPKDRWGFWYAWGLGKEQKCIFIFQTTRQLNGGRRRGSRNSSNATDLLIPESDNSDHLQVLPSSPLSPKDSMNISEPRYLQVQILEGKWSSQAPECLPSQMHQIRK
jgi:hypothetical protein